MVDDNLEQSKANTICRFRKSADQIDKTNIC